MYSARAPFCATPRTPTRFRSCCSFFMQSAARAIRQFNPETSFRSQKLNRREAMTDTRTPTEMKEVVREKYGQAALRVKKGGSTCCGATPASDSCCDPITTNLYDAAQVGQLPDEAVLASLGCG